jgi:hypothetical protein
MYRCRPKVYQLWYTGTYCTEFYASKVASICLCELEGLSRCNITINMFKLLVVLCVFDWSCPKCLSPTYFVHAQQYLYTLDILLLVCIQETSHHPRERTKRRTESENKIVVPSRPTRYLNCIQVLVQVPPLKLPK